jgi:DNA-binding PadR family transcriptional regulator
MNTPVESKSQVRELTTTSYGILGLLALRPFSTYELTRQMKRSYHRIWPRAESNVYAEPKRLVEAGLARADEEWTGKRRRTIYSITDAGRRALLDWHAAPSAPSRFESEALLKVFLGDSGTKADVLRSLGEMRAEAEAELDFWRRIAAEYLEGLGPFPERLHLPILIMRMIWGRLESDVRIADWAISEVERWPDVGGPEDREFAFGVMRDLLGRPAPGGNGPPGT